MQSITDPELVLNGDFEELGDEKVVNGTFSANSNWSNVGSNGWTIDTNEQTANYTNISTYIFQGISTAQNKAYKVVLDIEHTSGILLVKSFNAQTIITVNTPGRQTLTGYFTEEDTNVNFGFIPSGSNVSGKIHSVSVKEVSNWTLENGWSIEDGKLKSNGTVNVTAYQENILSQSGNIYKIKFDVNVISGSLSTRVRMGDHINGHTTVSNITSEGSYTLYATAVANQDNLNFTTLSDNTAVYTIDNVSVKDVTFSTDVDLARINYDSNGDNGHILLEPTSTNLITYSEDFSFITRTPNAATSPSGKNNATKLIGNDTSRDPSNSYIGASTSASAPYSASIFAKKGEYDYLVLGIGGYNEGFYAIFNLSNGTVSTSPTASGTTASIEDYDNGWFRCIITTTSTLGTEILFTTPSVDGTLTTDYTSTTNGVYVWGAQLEELSYATSYIPNHGTALGVTRATEILTGSGNSTLINSTEGVLYAEIAALADDLTNRCIALSDGTADDRVTLVFGDDSNKIRAIVKSDGSTSFDEEYTVTSTLDYHKVAIKYKANDFALWIDGVERFTDTSGSAPIGLNKLAFDTGISILNFYGKCKALAVFNEALEDDELELLTGVTNYGSFSELASTNGYTII
jgi:hypothetical protein